MDFLAVLLLSLAVSPVSSLPNQLPTIIEGKGRKTIPEINQGLNLVEGDIKQINRGVQKSVILGQQYRWTDKRIPYVFNGSLSINDRGVILRAFEQMRLKSCIEFVPRTTEEDYVSIESQDGCWSDIGMRGGMQTLSIGDGCAFLSTVEHEFLHCLGFNHEQSRYDRDDYVEIITENIIAAQLHNFDKKSEQSSTTQGTPYDYTSVMHYGQDAFTNGNGNTIHTRVPRFQNVIGQEYDLSPWDSYELSKLYNCNKSISYLDGCSFDGYNSMCGMTACDSKWSVRSFVYTGPDSDHTGLPSLGVPAVSMNDTSSVPGYFAHYSTMYESEGASAVLQSKEMTRRRACNIQCLEFFYYHSGAQTDQLNIWIREYVNNTDVIGTVRHMNQITGPATNRWLLHYVPLDASGAFSVEFEGRKGAGSSSGGFSVDDINFLESECPHNVWQIRNFMEAVNSTSDGHMYSPLFYSPEGYRYQAVLQLSEEIISVSVRLVSGLYDELLPWPCPWRQVTFVLLDQNPDVRQRMSSQDSITTDPKEVFGDNYLWNKPSVVGTPYITADKEVVNVTASKSFNIKLNKIRLNDREFVKGGDLILLFSMQDISGLLLSDSLPCPVLISKGDYVPPYKGAEDAPCSQRQIPTPEPTESECLDIFCSSANIIHPSVALLLALILLLVN
ncbi:meprin A subunit beta [Astyanax mexicanus]|uniref:meprin A subunit beta n=1 Tax=Astyanax mexicanus TaxID=7994 RepID=UPI0020CACEBA|nr:meprin A subunit beta [Astyanax mexicanus]